MLSEKASDYALGNCQCKMTIALNRLVYYCDYSTFASRALWRYLRRSVGSF